MSLLEHFANQKQAFQQQRYPTRQARAQHLNQLKNSILQHNEDISKAIAQDFVHRSRHETKMLEIFPSVQGINHAISNLKSWMHRRRCPTPLWFKSARTFVIPQPLGVIGIITPWNYPLYLSIGPLTCALAAGNRVMLKLSENTPHFNACLKKILSTNFSEDHICVIEGEVEVGIAFSKLPFDHLLFTGATENGRRIMANASANLTPVTLELGGKSPVIIGQDADLKTAAKRIIAGKLFNAGQTCVAPDHLWIHETQLATFLVHAKAAAFASYHPLANNPDYTNIINAAHYQRLNSLLTDALSKGAEAISLLDLSGPIRAQLFTPQILLHCTPEMHLMQEEIFGPLLPIRTYQNFNDVIKNIQQEPSPLALYYFGYNASEREKIYTQTLSGSVAINETLVQIAQDALPYGGVGESGMGHYHGEHGFNISQNANPSSFNHA